MIKGVVFDMDGLMIDTEKLLVKFWCQACREKGFNMEMNQALQMRSLTSKLASDKLKSFFGDEIDYTEIRNRRRELMEEYLLKNKIEMKKGLVELLTYLTENNYRVAVATSTDFNRTKKYLEEINVFNYFDTFLCGPMVDNGKPAPDIYIKAAEKLGILPENLLALEDSPNGVISAAAAGFKTVMIPDLDKPDEEIKGLLYGVVENLEQVINLLSNK